VDPHERFNEILEGLTDILEMKVVSGDPVTREQELHSELDNLALMYGTEFLDRQFVLWEKKMR